jgi:hypothetical protein
VDAPLDSLLLPFEVSHHSLCRSHLLAFGHDILVYPLTLFEKLIYKSSLESSLNSHRRFGDRSCRTQYFFLCDEGFLSILMVNGKGLTRGSLCTVHILMKMMGYLHSIAFFKLRFEDEVSRSLWVYSDSLAQLMYM